MNYIQLLSFWGDIGKELGHIALKILFLPFTLIFLLLDGVVYTLVAYSYKLFELMARMNFNTIYMWLQPVIDRIQALILVLVLFMVGYTLITYLIDPDKVGNGATGVALLKNIAIAAILLVFYSTIFDLLNEFTFVLIGAPENYNYDVLDDWFDVKNNNEPGLISNLIFGPGGTQNEEGEEYDFGRTLAVSTLSIFLHKKGFSYYTREENSSLATIYSDAMDPKKDFSLISLPGVALDINFIDNDNSEVGGTTVPIEYKYPIISTAVGLYLVYTLVTIAIEIGVRAFKLIILQILAPVAIITIIKDGWKSKIWQNFLKTLGSVYANLFIRVASMYFITAFISIAWNNINDLYGNENLPNGFTQYILLILIIVAGYKMAKTFPQFIDQVLGTKLADNTGGFGGFLKSLAAGTAGLALGTGAGLQAARANGLSAGATAFNALRSGYQGARAGIESKGKNIAKTLAGNTAQARTNAEQMKGRGGTLRSNIGYGIRERTGANYAGAIRTAELTSRENTRHTNAVNAANTAYNAAQQRTQADTTRVNTTHAQNMRNVRDAMDNENASYTSQMNTINSNRTVENDRHTKTMNKFESDTRMHQTNIAQATETMSTTDSRFSFAGGGSIQYGKSEDSFAHTVADNNSEYIRLNSEAEAARHTALTTEYKQSYKLDGSVYTAEQQKADAMAHADNLKAQAEAAYRQAESDARTEFQSARSAAVGADEAAIRQIEHDKVIETRKHEHNVKIIDRDQTKIETTHQTNVTNIKTTEKVANDWHEQETQKINAQMQADTKAHEAAVNQENAVHTTNTKETDRLMQRYTGKKPGGN